MTLLWIINEYVEYRQCQDFDDYFPERTYCFCSLFLTHFLFIVFCYLEISYVTCVWKKLCFLEDNCGVGLCTSNKTLYIVLCLLSVPRLYRQHTHHYSDIVQRCLSPHEKNQTKIWQLYSSAAHLHSLDRL